MKRYNLVCSDLVYCVAHCKNKTCQISKQFVPIHGDCSTADFSDRCDNFVRSKR